MNFIKEFRQFIAQGNVVELAVAVIIGAAFGSIVSSLVDDIITPILLNPALKAANVSAISAWPAGAVIVALINFIVIAFVVFLIVRGLEAMKRGERPISAPAPDPQAQLAAAATRLAEALERRQL